MILLIAIFCVIAYCVLAVVFLATPALQLRLVSPIALDFVRTMVAISLPTSLCTLIVVCTMYAETLRRSKLGRSGMNQNDPDFVSGFNRAYNCVLHGRSSATEQLETDLLFPISKAYTEGLKAGLTAASVRKNASSGSNQT